MSSKQPFAPFGAALKHLRESREKTEADLSGAVEIDVPKLKAYESGEVRPPEDILLLIIQHFDLKDDAAHELWRLAGYGDMPGDIESIIENVLNQDVSSAKVVMVSPHDARIVYTDMIQISVNNFGVVVNFLQGAGPNNQPLAVSRVGMSVEHARSVMELLRKTLDQAQKASQSKPPRQLGPGSARSKSQE
jgi:transcriptional regulator with XRE-family HTH domain